MLVSAVEIPGFLFCLFLLGFLSYQCYGLGALYYKTAKAHCIDHKKSSTNSFVSISPTFLFIYKIVAGFFILFELDWCRR